MAIEYTVVSERGVDGSGNRKRSVVDIEYTAEAYSSGVDVDKAGVNAPQVLEELHVMDDAADANLVKYDAANAKLRVYLGGSGTEFSGNLSRTVRVVVEGY